MQVLYMIFVLTSLPGFAVEHCSLLIGVGRKINLDMQKVAE